jgi:SAM-dependent methyltransferase
MAPLDRSSQPDTGMAKYRRYVSRALDAHPERDAALRYAIGGEFDAIGLIERDLLIAHGLNETSYLIDVGCGSGRLAKPLSTYLAGGYLGTDVVPDLLDYARNLVNRPDWRFELVSELKIPCPDATADMVCFFSVVTHLRHEESYLYLQEAQRSLRPGGRIVFSFLEFKIPSHWAVFEQDLQNVASDSHVDQFISRDAIAAWSEHLGLEVLGIYDGNESNVPISEPITLEDGTHFDSFAALGQSYAVLRRP